MRAAIWRTAFAQAATAGQSFIFTFHPEASVEPDLIDALRQLVESRAGHIFFVALTCPRQTTLERLSNASRSNFGKLTDPDLYNQIDANGGFEFPALPSALITIDTGSTAPDDAARKIAYAVAAHRA